MKGSHIIYVLLTILLCSCRSQFEQLRTSNDPQKILKAANEYYDEGEFLKAQTLYEQIIPFYRGKENAEGIFLKFSYTHYELAEYILAAHYFKSFTTTYYNSPKKEEAAFMAAYSSYKMSPSFRLDQTSSITAINEFQNFINLYPTSPRVDECNALIEELRGKMELKAFDQGKLYFDLSQYNSAIQSFETMLKEFPETEKAEEVRFLILKSSYQWAIKSVYEKREERLLKTIELTEKFKNKYKDSSYLTECSDIIQQCNNDLKRFQNG